MRTLSPSESEFVECWSEVIIKNGLPPALVEKTDATLSHRDTFSTKIIPETDKRLDEEGMTRLKPRMQKVGDIIISDGW